MERTLALSPLLPVPGSPPGTPPPRFRLLKRLGGGAAGTVYEARDRRLDRLVALKILHRSEPEAVERFRREARLLARCEHESICRLYDAGTLGGRPFLALELVAGANLRELAPRLSLAAKLGAVDRVLGALSAVHAQGIVHRDVKPANVVLGRRGDGRIRVCLVDFGIARQAGDAHTTQIGFVLGTPAYAAPEQLAGDEVDGRADLYAVGSMLYELLAGRPPFGGGEVAKVYRRVMTETATPLDLLNPEVPPSLARTVSRCLEKDPADRFQTADELRAALRDSRTPTWAPSTA